MIDKSYTKSDGTEVLQYKAEAGDKFTLQEEKARHYPPGGRSKFDNYLINATTEDGRECVIQLTAGQFRGMEKWGNLVGQEVECEEYKSSYGRMCVGFRKRGGAQAKPKLSLGSSSQVSKAIPKELMGLVREVRDNLDDYSKEELMTAIAEQVEDKEMQEAIYKQAQHFR